MARAKKAESDSVVHYEMSGGGGHVVVTLYCTDPKGDVWTAKGSCVAEPAAVETMRTHLDTQVRACWGA